LAQRNARTPNSFFEYTFSPFAPPIGRATSIGWWISSSSILQGLSFDF
jgi:hypothetical protein